MGLFDKIKKGVQGAMQQPPQAQQQQQAPQQQQYSAPPPQEEEVDTSSSSADDDEVDDWGGWDPNDHEEMWYRVKSIEWAGNQGGDDAADAKAREYGLRDFAHVRIVRETFTRHFGDSHEFMQAAYAASSRQGREMVQGAGAANSEIFEPIEGVTLQTYATVQARAGSLGTEEGAWPRLLAEHGLDEAKWGRVSAEWLKRMSGQGTSDPNATMALLTEYGKFFGQAGQGQFGAAAAANAGQAGLLNQGQGAVGAAPVTLDRYAEIMGAQSAWAQQGRDVNAMLRSQFNMSAIDFSNISQYWSAEIQRDYRIALQLGDMQTQYEKRYLAQGGGGPDSDLSV